MNESKISVRYSKALFLLAQEKNLIEPIQADMDVLANIIIESEDFRFFFFSPINKPSVKTAAIETIFSNNKLNAITLQFLKMLIENNRFQYLENIARNYSDIYKKYKGIKSVRFQSVYEPDENTKKRITQILKDFYKAEIDLQVNLKPEIIGGFVLRVDDHQYDASVATALKKMKSALKE
jgi:F-type H+-transporting ATPase subunit delta